MKTFYDQVREAEAVAAKKVFTVYDVLAVGYNLEPLVCLACGSHEVTFLQYVGDAQCGSCGKWQLAECGSELPDIDEPPTSCIFCGSDGLRYHDAAGDSYCPDCGKWQDNGES